MNVWLIGAGIMAQEYLKVLHSMNINPVIVGRGEESAHSFEIETGTYVQRGGLVKYLSVAEKLPDAAIVSVSVNELASTAMHLLRSGVKRILIEKPAGLTADEIQNLAGEAKLCNAEVVVGYNRRFYSSVRMARQMIEEDGGVQSFHFEFTEWGYKIGPLPKRDVIKQNWLLANSSHVIDLAFYLGGAPEAISSFRAGGLPWHQTGSVFSGAGYCKTGALFSYQANWDAPGRWGVELCTSKNRYILRPLEQLFVMEKGKVKVTEFIPLDVEIDRAYKPGLLLQTQAFLEKKSSNVACMISEQVSMASHYRAIAGY